MQRWSSLEGGSRAPPGSAKQHRRPWQRHSAVPGAEHVRVGGALCGTLCTTDRHSVSRLPASALWPVSGQGRGAAAHPCTVILARWHLPHKACGAVGRQRQEGQPRHARLHVTIVPGSPLCQPRLTAMHHMCMGWLPPGRVWFNALVRACDLLAPRASQHSRRQGALAPWLQPSCTHSTLAASSGSSTSGGQVCDFDKTG